ncbi:MAG: TolC family protein [Candidatus Omnitrophica bacterium]|nr:TolC family protein [Candidatus Omnitrophota bacterium]
MGISKSPKKFLIIPILLLIISPLVSAQDNKKEINHYLIQARIKYDNSKYEEAIEWYNKALELDPSNKKALKYIKKAKDKSARVGKKNEARQTKNKAAAKTSPMPKSKGMAPVMPEILIATPALKTPEPTFEKPSKETLLLEDAVELGLKNHLPAQIALEQVKLARLKEREALRGLFPQASVRWEESSGRVSSLDYAGRDYHLDLQHPLYHGGELQYTWQQAKVNLKISQENYSKTREDYTIELTKAYYDYVRAIKNFAVQESLLKDLEADFSIAKKELDSGITTLVEFLNVQSKYNQAYYAYLSSENAFSLARSNFLQLLNLDEKSSVNVKVDTEMVFRENKIDLDECIKLAYENRTDLKINELALKAADLGGKVTKSKLLPKVDVTGSVGKSGEVFTPGNIEMRDDWFVGAKVSVPWGPNTMEYSYKNEHQAPSLSAFQPTLNETHSVTMNILDNMESYTQMESSEVARQHAYSDLIKGKQTAASEVREAYFGYQESVIKVKNSIANRELYQKEIAVTKEKRNMNEARTEDVVEAKVKLASEEVNYNSAIVENVTAIAKLNNAIGIKNYFK